MGTGIRAAGLAVAELDRNGEIGGAVVGGAVGRQPCHGEFYKAIIIYPACEDILIRDRVPPAPSSHPSLPIPNHLCPILLSFSPSLLSNLTSVDFLDPHKKSSPLPALESYSVSQNSQGLRQPNQGDRGHRASGAEPCQGDWISGY